MTGGSLLAGLATSAAIAAGGWRAGALMPRGAAAATLVGTSVMAGASWRGAVLLGTFFGTGSGLSKWGSQPDTVEKGGRRDERQVLANGGVAALAAAFSPLLGEQRSFLVLAGALAAATSDTWATEIGATSAERPRMILSGWHVPAGLSGGVTARGTLASIAGALLVGGLTAGLMPARDDSTAKLKVAMSTALAGVSGSLVDSILGEVVQGKRWSREHQTLVEKDEHHGSPTLPVGGLAWFDNDLVNLCCTLTGALVAGLAWSRIEHDQAGLTLVTSEADPGGGGRASR